ncbi:SDR family oxidoreductase [Paracoccus shanxieyensis]|uniref:SDR family oxidoreductase n=1 Tax=Paracoccus shanxieyensis TaxID=2675752 RepID=A0A6L6J2P2_9RHOB|nr:SDR family oxidoreductase [Paracoccus shanxieyensis]MTH64997.1 SDR family oxidoreductase [Paracoccus shanxieyensis]MTH88099.1 SDR family oxidoreductase [Paracoccus shanxieyensis]
MTMLKDRVALIAGASAGIGRAIAELFAAEGAAVVLMARRAGPLDEVAHGIRARGGRAAVVVGDATQADPHLRAVALACDQFGGLDIAVNNAGLVGPVKPLADLAPEDWDQVLATNLTAGFLGVRAQIPAMLRRGSGAIIMISSFVGSSVGLPGMAAYGAAKAGLSGLVKGIAADYGHLGIRANALLPGGTDTAMAGDQAQKDWAAGLHAMKRIAAPSEIATAALFLASPMASFVTGTALYADGGNAAVK